MAYSADSVAIIGESVGGALTVWAYKTADAIVTVRGDDYFTNGDALGMKVGDVVLVSDTTTPGVTVNRVSAVTAGGAATIVAG